MSDNGTAVRYTPGNAVLLCNDRRVVILRLVADHGLVGEAWSRLEDGASIDQVLEVILGEGLRTVSDFALAERSGGSVRLILRGGINAEVRRDFGAEKLQTEGIWVDKRIEGRGVLALTVDGAEGSGQQLPLHGGVVLAGGALLTLDDASEHAEGIAAPAEATDAAAEPLAEQANAPVLPQQPARPGFPAQPAYEQPPVLGQQPAFGAPESQQQRANEHGFIPVQDGGFPPPPPPGHADGGFGAGATAVGAAGDVFPPQAHVHDARDDVRPEWDESPAPAPALGFEEESPAQDAFEPTAPYSVVDHGDDDQDEDGTPTQMTTARGGGYHGPVMVLPDGQEIELEGPVIIGRAPRTPEGHPGSPRLVPMADPERDVSATHLEVTFDGQRVLVTDLKSTNGTDLCEPGQPVRLLQPDQPTELIPGAYLMLAGSQKVTFEAR